MCGFSSCATVNPPMTKMALQVARARTASQGSHFYAAALCTHAGTKWCKVKTKPKSIVAKAKAVVSADKSEVALMVEKFEHEGEYACFDSQPSTVVTLELESRQGEAATLVGRAEFDPGKPPSGDIVTFKSTEGRSVATLRIVSRPSKAARASKGRPTTAAAANGTASSEAASITQLSSEDGGSLKQQLEAQRRLTAEAKRKCEDAEVQLSLLKEQTQRAQEEKHKARVQEKSTRQSEPRLVARSEEQQTLELELQEVHLKIAAAMDERDELKERYRSILEAIHKGDGSEAEQAIAVAEASLRVELEKKGAYMYQPQKALTRDRRGRADQRRGTQP